MATTTDRAGAYRHGERVAAICALALNVPFYLLCLWGMVKLGKIDAGRSRGVSEGVAMIVGMLEVSWGLTAAAVRACAHFIRDTDESDDLRREGPALLLGAGALVAAGSSLMLLSIAGPGRLVPPTWGLVVVMLLGILATVFLTMRLRVLDELNRAVARESGHLAFEWLSVVGGTWAILTHLGFVPAPTPLNWLTMLYGFGFLAGIVASARRGAFDDIKYRHVRFVIVTLLVTILLVVAYGLATLFKTRCLPPHCRAISITLSSSRQMSHRAIQQLVPALREREGPDGRETCTNCHK